MLKRLTIWVDASALADLKRLSVDRERGLGWLIRKAIVEFIERENKKP